MPIKIPIETTFDPKGTSAAIKELTQVAQAKAKLAQSDAQIVASSAKVAIAQNQVAVSAARVSVAQNQIVVSANKAAQSQNQLAVSATKVGTEIAKQATAQNQAAISALRLAAAQEKAAKPPSTSLAGYFEKLKGDITGAALAMVGYGAAVQGATAFAESFQDAFNFKTELDSTTASINIQLKGVRDSGQVWNEAAAYANKYKLTQAETSSTVQASIGILRNSQASVEDTFSVLQRMTLLAPGKTIEDAAFSVRELASGDIMSIADQFNISRTKAYEMRDAIAAGGDTVAILGKFLDQSGISMDALKVKTEGAAGAQKDLAIEQEKMKLAQAELAAGPGLQALRAEIALTQDATALLKGDWTALGDAINDSGLGALNPILGAMANYNNAVLTSGQGTLDWISRLRGVEPAASAAANATAIDAVETQRLGVAHVAAASATDQAAAAAAKNAAELATELEKKQQSTVVSNELKDAQTQLAALGGMVAGGMQTAGQAALVLSMQYGIAYEEALKLINAQAQLAGAGTRGNVKMTYAQSRDQREQQMAGGGPQQATNNAQAYVKTLQEGAKATTEAAAAQRHLDEVRGGSSVVIANLKSDLKNANLTEAERIDLMAKLTTAEQAAAKAGGARASAAEKVAQKLVKIEQDAADKIMAINQRLADEQAAAARKLAADIETSTADMIADQEADDLDLIGAKEENMDRLRAREEAEANARVAQAAAVSEAQARSAAGDAETASAVLDLREQNIQKQQKLDEDYANKRAELAGNPEELAALKQQYDEATAALADATAQRVALAEAEAQQRQDKANAEKDAAIAAATEAGNALAATGKSAGTAAGQVDAMISRLHAIPTDVTTTVHVNMVNGGGSGSDSTSSSSGGSKVSSAGGGTFLTNGPTHFTVGDNPGGREIVSVTPIGAKGTTSVSGNVAQLAGGGVVDVAADDAQKRLDAANARAKTLPGAAVGAAGGTKKAASAAAKEEKAAKPAIADFAKAAKDNLDLLGETLKLRTVVQDPATWRPINDAVLQSAAMDANKVARTFAQIAATYDTKVLESAKLYTDALKGTYDVIKDGMETTDRLRGSDLSIPTAALQNFQANAFAVIDTVGRIGSKAATIPEASVTALGNISATLAVLPSLGMLGGGGGGNTSNVSNMGGININIYQQPGQSTQALVQQVMQGINQQMGTRR